MRIGEVAKQSGLTTSRIRYYEANGLLPAAARTGNGYRDYPDSVVSTLRLIDEAQALGFSLTEISAVLAKVDDGHPPKRDIVTALRDKLASIDQHLLEVTQRRQRILGLIGRIEVECLDGEMHDKKPKRRMSA